MQTYSDQQQADFAAGVDAPLDDVDALMASSGKLFTKESPQGLFNNLKQKCKHRNLTETLTRPKVIEGTVWEVELKIDGVSYGIGRDSTIHKAKERASI